MLVYALKFFGILAGRCGKLSAPHCIPAAAPLAERLGHLLAVVVVVSSSLFQRSIVSGLLCKS